MKVVLKVQSLLHYALIITTDSYDYSDYSSLIELCIFVTRRVDELKRELVFNNICYMENIKNYVQYFTVNFIVGLINRARQITQLSCYSRR